jgi:putative transposase
MPRRHTAPRDQKTQFIADYLRRTLSITELCVLYGVSRKTGDTWIARSLTSGPSCLEQRSRKPSSSGSVAKTASELVQGAVHRCP